MLWLSLLALAAVLCCGMGIFGSGDKTNTTNQSDQRQAGSDQAIVQRDSSQAGGVANSSASGGSNAVGAGGRYNQASGVGSTLINAEAGSVHDVHGNLTNQNVDTDVIAAFGGTLRDILGTQSAASQAQSATLAGIVSDQATASQNLFSDIGAKISDLAKNQQTGGETDRNKIILYVVLGLLGLLGFFTFVTRR